MKKNHDQVPSSRKYSREGGLPPTNAIPLPNTPNGMNFEHVEAEAYYRIVERDTHEEREQALPTEPTHDLLPQPNSVGENERDWLYDMKLRRQVEEGGRFMHRPMANRKALGDRYDTDD